MGKRRHAVPKRKRAQSQSSVTNHPRWVQWLNGVPAPYYLLAAIVVAGLIGAFVIWLDEKTLALVAFVAFGSLLVWWIRSVSRGWRDAELVERIIGVLGCVLLMGGSAAQLVRFLLLRSE